MALDCVYDADEMKEVFFLCAHLSSNGLLLKGNMCLTLGPLPKPKMSL